MRGVKGALSFMARLERVSIWGRSPWRLGSLTVLSPSLLATIVASVQVSLGAPSELMTGFPDLPVARSTSQETYHERPKALLRTAQNTNGLTLSIAIDSKKNRDYVKADDTFSSFVYEALAQGDTIKFQLASKDIVGAGRALPRFKSVAYSKTRHNLRPYSLLLRLGTMGRALCRYLTPIWTCLQRHGSSALFATFRNRHYVRRRKLQPRNRHRELWLGCGQQWTASLHVRREFDAIARVRRRCRII